MDLDNILNKNMARHGKTGKDLKYCDFSERIYPYVEGKITGEEEKRVIEQHLQGCEFCQIIQTGWAKIKDNKQEIFSKVNEGIRQFQKDVIEKERPKRLIMLHSMTQVAEIFSPLNFHEGAFQPARYGISSDANVPFYRTKLLFLESDPAKKPNIESLKEDLKKEEKKYNLIRPIFKEFSHTLEITDPQNWEETIGFIHFDYGERYLKAKYSREELIEAAPLRVYLKGDIPRKSERKETEEGPALCFDLGDKSPDYGLIIQYVKKQVKQNK